MESRASGRPLSLPLIRSRDGRGSLSKLSLFLRLATDCSLQRIEVWKMQVSEDEYVCRRQRLGVGRTMDEREQQWTTYGLLGDDEMGGLGRIQGYKIQNLRIQGSSRGTHASSSGKRGGGVR